MTLILCTVATHNEGYFDSLMDSCKKNKLNLKILGWNKKWKGFVWRFALIVNFLEKLKDDNIVCFIDGFDVLSLVDEKTIIDKFSNFNSKIVVSCDNPANIIWNTLSLFYYGKCDGNQLNFGGYIGYVKYLKLLFKKMCEIHDCNKFDLDDQKILITTCNKTDFFKKYVKVDNDGLIFLNVFTDGLLLVNPIITENNKYFYFNKNNKLINKKTGKIPCFVHGPGFVNIDVIVNKYKLKKPIDKSTKKKIYKKVSTRIYKTIKKSLNFDVIISLLICLIVIFSFNRLNDAHPQ